MGPNDLWVKVVGVKYKCLNDAMPRIDQTRHNTNLWRGITECWNTIEMNFMQGVHNGRTIQCWEDH